MDAVSGSAFGITCECYMVGLLRDNIFELLCLKYTAPACHLVMFVAPVGAAAHHVCEGRILLVSVGRLCEFFAAVCAVSVGPAVLWSGRS